MAELIAMKSESLDPPKTKRKRSKPNKKWTMEEEIKILDFLKDQQDFEKPTAQIFYRKFIVQSPHVGITWDLIRWKVRNMKQSYVKAEKFRTSTGAGLLQSEKGLFSIKAKLVKMCPHYEMLHEIFSTKSEINNNELCSLDTADTIFFEQNTAHNADCDGSGSFHRSSPMFLFPSATSDSYPVTFESVEFCARSDPQEQCIHSTPPAKASTSPAQADVITSAPNKISKQHQNVHSFAEKLKKAAPKTGLSQLSQIQAERTDIQRKRLELEKERFQNEILIEKRKIAIEEERFRAELEFKKEELNLRRLELEKDEKLKKMELEYKEKIAMYEIDCKYKKNISND